MTESSNLRPLSADAAVISATFADWRTVKGRKMLQLVFEVPLEEQANALNALGPPMPDNPKWCAITVLTKPASAHPVPERPAEPSSPIEQSGGAALIDDLSANCPTCRGSGKILQMYARGPGDAPGNQMVGCPNCPKGQAYNDHIQGLRQAQSQAAEVHRKRFSEMTPGERLVARAGMLPGDERFRAWVTEKLNASPSGDGPFNDMVSETRAQEYIRHHCCGGGSRALIGEYPECADRFQAMLTEFQMDVGEIPRPR